MDKKDKDSLTKGVSETLKKAIATGIGVISGEENIREKLTDLNLHKDVANYIMGVTDKVKDDVLEILKTEFRNFLYGDDWQENIKKLLSGTTIEINATVKIHQDGETIEKKVNLENKIPEDDSPEDDSNE